jgi:hypothetical protein
MQAELQKTRLSPILLFKGEFATGNVYLWSGVGNLVYGGQTYLGTGAFGTISTLKETSDLVAQGATLTLSGIPSDLLALALDEARLGKRCWIYLGAIDGSGNVINAVYAAFAGRMDVPIISDGDTTCTIQISVESVLVDMKRSRERRYTPEDQAIEHPGDNCFQFMAALQNTSLIWGNSQVSYKPGYTAPTLYQVR